MKTAIIMLSVVAITVLFTVTSLRTYPVLLFGYVILIPLLCAVVGRVKI